MKPFRQNAALLVMLASLGLLAGCASSGIGSNSSEQKMVSDLVTERVITRAFYDEPGLVGANIIVGCVDGIVTLDGTVNNSSQVALAERVARGVEGVVEVRNGITS